MLEQLLKEAASRFNLSTATVSSLVRGLLSMMTDERSGGVDGFIDQFRRAGFGDTLTSWFGGKEGRTLTPADVESALGVGALDTLASANGITRAATSSVLAFVVPKLLGLLTPNGVLPTTAALRSQMPALLGRPGVERPIVQRIERPVSIRPYVVEQRAWPAWLPWAAVALLALIGWLWLRAPGGSINPQLTVSNRD